MFVMFGLQKLRDQVGSRTKRLSDQPSPSDRSSPSVQNKDAWLAGFCSMAGRSRHLKTAVYDGLCVLYYRQRAEGLQNDKVRGHFVPQFSSSFALPQLTWQWTSHPNKDRQQISLMQGTQVAKETCSNVQTEKKKKKKHQTDHKKKLQNPTSWMVMEFIRISLTRIFPISLAVHWGSPGHLTCSPKVCK